MTAATPGTLRGIYARFRELAPAPEPSAPDVTWQLSRYLLVNALRASARAEHETLSGGCLSMATLAEMTGNFGAVHLLEAQRLSPMRGPASPAAEVASAILDGGGIDEWLWEHSQALGIDANEVMRLAEAEARLKAAAQFQAAQ